MPPSIMQDTQPGVVAAAWLEGLIVRAGERLLLGYVSGQPGVSSTLRLYRMSAMRVGDDREVPLGAPISVLPSSGGKQ